MPPRVSPQVFHLMPAGTSYYVFNDMFRLNYGASRSRNCGRMRPVVLMLHLLTSHCVFWRCSVQVKPEMRSRGAGLLGEGGGIPRDDNIVSAGIAALWRCARHTMGAGGRRRVSCRRHPR